MADQETLADVPGTFDPTIHGLWKRFVDNHQIREGEWLRACEAGEFVGTCRHCGDYLIPRRPLKVAPTRWDYEAECRSRVAESKVDGIRVVTGCGATLCAPGGRLVKPHTPRYQKTGA